MVKILFEPINIGRLKLKNRIVKLPAQTNFANLDGSVSERMLYHYADVARGGCGLVIVEGTVVDDSSKRPTATGLFIDHDKYLPGLELLASTIKINGAKAVIQIAHTGRVTAFPETGTIVSASDGSFKNRIVRALSIDEIHHLVEQFGNAALRAKKAGFDAVEIHGYAGYLVGSFLSPLLNRRRDIYGGSIENRMRFPIRVIENIRSKVGSDYPLIFRFSVDEYIEGGLKLEESKIIAKKLGKSGIDAIDANMGISEHHYYMNPPMFFPPGFTVHLAAGIKKEVKIPVIASGRINDPVLAENILQTGKADLIGMARALFADPELPKKAAEDRLDDIRKCIGCNDGCLGRLYRHLSIGCTVNAAVGREKEFTIKRAEKAKRVVVVGGGPAGMEAARVAALRGHNVTLYEQKGELGGQTILASIPPYREDVKNVPLYLSNQIKKLGVKIELNKRVTAELVRELNPDVVIIATGAKFCIPDIPGIKGNNVVISNDVLVGRASVGETVLIVGGGMVGSEVADFLAEKGKKVTIIEMLDDIATDVEPMTRELLMSRLEKYQVRILTGLKVNEVTAEGLIGISNGNKPKRHVIKADTVVLALGSEPENTLSEELKDNAWEINLVGDCVSPRKIINAIYEGSYAARQI